jgi:murein DD-endopeptidase MepM/ murein hydrolase activator NlpD
VDRLEPERGLPQHAWFAGAMALVLLGIVASVLLGWNPMSGQRQQVAAALRRTPTPTAPPPTPTALAATPTQEPDALSARDTLDSARDPAREISPIAMPRPSPTPFPLRPRTFVDHYWLERPFGPQGQQRAERFYPYASRGDGTYPIHHGADFTSPMGTAIYAVADGIVRVAGDDRLQVYGARDDFYGLVVVQELNRTLNDEPIFVVYGHLSQVTVQPGQRVATGDKIGEVGMSGVAMGPHLHLEVRIGENDYLHTVNPDLWLRPLPGHGTLAGELLSARGEPIAEAQLVLFRAGSTTPYRFFTSYPAIRVNADPAWGENLCTGDVPAGQWMVQARYQGLVTSRDVTINAGETAWVSIRIGR